MENPFAVSDKTYNKPNRNAFPLSHSVNFTTKFGDIIPVLCKPVYSGDSFKCSPTFALQFMPMVFPVQSRIRAKLSYFYVRKRNLWKDYQDFYGKTKENLVPPYIKCTSQQKSRMFGLGQLADNFGIPVTAYGSFSNVPQVLELVYPSEFVAGTTLATRLQQMAYVWNGLYVPQNIGVGTSFTEVVGSSMSLQSIRSTVSSTSQGLYYGWFTDNKLDFSSAGSLSAITINLNRISSPNGSTLTTGLYFVGFDIDDKVIVKGSLGYDTTNSVYTVPSGDSLSDWQKVKRIFFVNFFSTTAASSGTCSCLGSTSVTFTPDYQSKNNSISIVDYPNSFPYGDSDDYQQRLSAMPFRAYEQIYNVYYRNSKNNPLIIGGVTEYNKICRTIDGGADTLIYDIKKHNWELDFLTSAVQSPQQGVAPLVGITASGNMTFQDSEGNIYRAQADLDDNGIIKGFKIGETGLPQGTLRALVDTVSSGISINDLRNVNSFQRWLETNIRRGMRYVDQVRSHFGVEVDYNAMEYPEYIGGFSRDVEINAIMNQTSGVAPLGELGALGRCFGSSNHSITKFCPENGYIIALLTVVPIPSYSQVLPKHFLLNSVFDEYFPEFGKIGMQPILMSEVCPIQQYMQKKEDMNKVFGYQRPWYDLLGSIDEVHGEFRTTLRDYLINRQFDTPPQLGESFLLVDDSQVNDVFAVTEDNHAKILGQIYHNIGAKRPIPLFGIPSLE